MNLGLFRKQAVDSYLRPDAPAGIVTILPPSSLVVFGVMFALFVGLGAVAGFGQAQVVAPGRGVVRFDQPPIVVHAPRGGRVRRIGRASHASGATGDVLVELDPGDGAASTARCQEELAVDRRDLGALERRMTEWNDGAASGRDASTALVLLSQIRTQREKVNVLATRCDATAAHLERATVRFPVDATVLDVMVSEGAEVKEGDGLALLTPRAARLVGYVVLPEARRSEVEPGQSVRLRFDALPADEVGVGSGRVTRVLDVLPGHAKLAKADADDGGAFVEVSVDAMPAGAAARPGLTFDAHVLTRRVALARLLFGR